MISTVNCHFLESSLVCGFAQETCAVSNKKLVQVCSAYWFLVQWKQYISAIVSICLTMKRRTLYEFAVATCCYQCLGPFGDALATLLTLLRSVENGVSSAKVEVVERAV